MNMQPLVHIDGRKLVDRNNLHEALSVAFGFPAWCGTGFDAWADCLTSLDAPTHGMTSVHAPPGGVVVLQIDNCKHLRNRRPDLLDRIAELAAFVNWSKIDVGEPAVIALAYRC